MPKITKDKGTTVRIFIDWTDPDTGVPIDPNTVEFKLREPDLTVLTYEYGTDPEVVRTVAGTYYISVLLDQEGTYHWKWTGTGAINVSAVVPGDLDSVSRVDF